MRNFWILMALLASALIGWWNYAAPPAHHVVAPAHQVGPVPAAITAVKSADDFIAHT